MKTSIAFGLMAACIGLHAQTTTDAERLRISAERAQLEASFAVDNTACYKKFWVNNCLDEVKARQRVAMADLQRQEIVLNDQARKAKAAEQLQKTEDKTSSEKVQQEADRRAEALKEFDKRMARDQQKSDDRVVLQAGEKAREAALVSRGKKNQDKAARRTAGQARAAEELQKYNERQAKAQERLAQRAKDTSGRTKSAAKPLPPPSLTSAPQPSASQAR